MSWTITHTKSLIQPAQKYLHIHATIDLNDLTADVA